MSRSFCNKIHGHLPQVRYEPFSSPKTKTYCYKELPVSYTKLLQTIFLYGLESLASLEKWIKKLFQKISFMRAL